MPEHLHMAIDDNIKISHFLNAVDKGSQRPQDRVGLLDYMAPGEGGPAAAAASLPSTSLLPMR